MDELYIFEIRDNDRDYSDINLIVYGIKNSFMTPLNDKFKIGFSAFPSFENIMDHLTNKKINTLNTYSPNNLELVCSQPYELGDFTDEEISSGACFYRFDHLEFFPSKKEKQILKENKINIKHLNNREVTELEKTLKYHR